MPYVRIIGGKESVRSWCMPGVNPRIKGDFDAVRQDNQGKRIG
jgi:hypothetical protein